MKSINEHLSAVRLAYRQELAFFKSFHTNRVNWLIHAVTIPLEWTATLLFLATLQLHWVVAISTGLYHGCVGSRLSPSAAVAQLVFCSIASRLSERLGQRQSIVAAVAMHIVAWFLQVVVGHGMFERNSPAMATKLTFNSIVLSVLLAWDSF